MPRDMKCVICKAVFDAPKRKKTCSDTCKVALRSKNLMRGHVVPTQPKRAVLWTDELPDVSILPAAYLKRAADYWGSLVSTTDTRKRID